MKTQKGISTLIGIIIIVAAAVVAFGGVFGYQYLTQQKGEPTIIENNQPIVGNDKDAHGCIGSAGYSWCEAKQKCLRTWEEPCAVDQTAGWKTYKNTEYGFEFKYPSGFTVLNTGGNNKFLEIKSPQQSTLPAYWYIEVNKNTEGFTAQQLADKDGAPQSAASPTKNKIVEQITFNNIEGVKATMDSPPSDANPQDPNYVQKNTLNYTDIFVTKNNNYLIFFCINKDGLKNYNQEDFYKMLDTFKFTN